MVLFDSFEEVYTDTPDADVTDIYHPAVGFMQVRVSESLTDVVGTITCLEKEDWEPYALHVQGMTREHFVTALRDPLHLSRFAGIALRAQLSQTNMQP